jgi:serine/threonine protein kinase
MAERAFGPYRLVRQIAVGGMAEIHLAKTRGIAGFEKFVALKMIHPNFAQDEQFIQMLIDEAKIAVQLQHVNIAQTFDLGRVGDTYYITMEYVDGADLYKILRRGSEQDLDMPLDVCAFVAKEAATGLDHAHRKKDMAGNPLGIVHRDVSPQNVLISHAGEVKLVDFGIAKATMRARQTQVGVIKGKYYYMSPEQAWGDPLDHRSDIFSCGIVLYEMMTGQMLYLEEDLHKLLEMVRRAAIAPPTRLRRDVPPQLERIVMHALAKNPDERYQSAADMAADLERFLHTYSPVFTASKLTAHLRKVIGDPVPVGEAPSAGPRNPQQQTQPVDRREISDENSVIFRVAELKARDEAQAQAQAPAPRRAPTARPVPRGDDESTAAELPRNTVRRPATEPPPTAPVRRPPTARPMPQVPTRVPQKITVPPSSPTATTQVPGKLPRPPGGGMIDVPTMALEATDLAEVGEVEEMTAISSGPPGGLDYGDYEPTVMDQPEALEPPDSEDGPTITRDGKGVPLPAAVQLSSSETMPRPHSELRSKIRPGAPAHPALAASTPTPAVSELRKPRGSRRTPPGGSVLQAIVQQAPSDPMPTVQMRNAPATSDGVPRSMESGPVPASTGATTPQPGFPGPPPGVAAGPPIPGANQLPVNYQMPQPQPGQPPMPLVAPPTPFPGSPAAQLPPHLVQYGGYGLPPAAQTIQPGYPYPYGQQAPLSFTKQMQAAIELDDIPQHLKFQENRSKKVVWAAVLIALFVGGIGLAVLFTRQANETPSASLVIESMPAGATVEVDGTPLPHVTPARFATEPGARHEIVVTAPRHKKWTQAVVVPSTGGDVKVVAVLAALRVKLQINSVPGGAEIWINGELRGVTPKVVEDLDPAIVKQVELRLRDHAPEVRTLDWGDREALGVEVIFPK